MTASFVTIATSEGRVFAAGRQLRNPARLAPMPEERATARFVPALARTTERSV
jgi:hypothetical protein